MESIDTTVIKICLTHGNLLLRDVVKSGKHASGTPRVRCKLCLQVSHQKHYASNKEKVLAKHNAYKKKNLSKVKESKKKHSLHFYKKIHDFKAGKKTDMTLDQVTKYYARRDKYEKRWREELHDLYIKHLIQKRHNISFDSIPQELVELKRAQIQLFRLIREKLGTVPMNFHPGRVKKISEICNDKKERSTKGVLDAWESLKV